MGVIAEDRFGELFDVAVEDARQLNPEQFDVVARFWAAPLREGRLASKVKELVALAVHASASTLHRPGIALYVRRALDAGASPEEVADVLLSITPLAVHTFSVAIPTLQAELKEAGRDEEAALPAMTEEARHIKRDFVRTRGYWTEQREVLACLMPDFFKAYMALSNEPWRSGVLEPKVRELMYIAIDCSITHMYELGLRIHIRNALKHGATRDEILEVFEIAAVLGASTYAAGISELLAARSEGRAARGEST